MTNEQSTNIDNDGGHCYRVNSMLSYGRWDRSNFEPLLYCWIVAVFTVQSLPLWDNISAQYLLLWDRSCDTYLVLWYSSSVQFFLLWDNISVFSFLLWNNSSVMFLVLCYSSSVQFFFCGIVAGCTHYYWGDSNKVQSFLLWDNSLCFCGIVAV